MTKELKQKIDKIVRDYYMSPKALTLYRNLKGLAYDVAEESAKELEAQIEKMKWHYLVEDPKDLPKKEGSYWVCTRDGRYKEDGSWEWTSKPLCMTAVWRDGIFGKAGGPPIIAWCELPKWEIKENED